MGPLPPVTTTTTTNSGNETWSEGCGMHVFMAMLGVAMLIMVGMAALLSLVLLVLWEVRGVVRYHTNGQR